MMGMLAVTLFFSLMVGSYFLLGEFRQQQRQLKNLQHEVLSQQEELLRSELDATTNYIHFMHSRTEQLLKDQIRQQVDQAVAVAQSLYEQTHKRLPPEQVATLIKEALRPIRFLEGRGYLFIDDMDGNCVLLPTAPQLEGRSLIDNRDDTGHYIMRGLLDAVDNPDGAGFSRYRWYPPGDNRRMADKLAYVRHFEPLGWVIGAGDYLYRVEDDVRQAVIRRLNSFRFGEHGYVTVIDRQGKTLINPALERLPMNTVTRDLQRSAINAIMNTADAGGGLVDYTWFYPDGRGPVTKRALVEVLPEWDWILSAGLYPDDLTPMLQRHQAELNRETRESIIAFGIALLLALALTFVLAWVYSRWLKRLFRRYEQDIADQKDHLLQNARDLELSAQVFNNATEGIVITSPDNRILAVNPAFTDITGYSAEEALGKNPSFMASGSHDARFYQVMWERLQKTGQWQGEVWNRRKDGALFPEWLSLNVVKEQGRVKNYIATLSDISLHKANEQRLRYLAEFDSLTDLPNRRLLADRVGQAIHQARSKSGELALLLIDLDRFKNINDSLGHEMGDKLLCVVAARLKALVPDEVTVSRVGGDEFVLLLPALHDPDYAALLARQVIEQISEPADLKQHRLTLTPSIGISIWPADGADFETLFRNADAALYHAKAHGRNQYQFFTQQMNDEVSRRLLMENALRKGIAEGELRLVYQPQYGMGSLALCGAEALVRWQHPEQGLVPPDFFIGLAEETGLIVELGEWVLREACHQGQQWREAGYPEIQLAVNVSAQQFREELAGQVQAVLDESGFPAEQLVIEVTESILMQNAQQSIAVLQQLKDLGVWLALDDFGTGYSSLAYLKRFPLDKLKIDKTFVSDLPEDTEDVAIVQAILGLAHSLNLDTVAEGVETSEQLLFLEDNGCQLAQGFLLDKPLWPDQMAERLRDEQEARATR